jgi:hypothetical protein
VESEVPQTTDGNREVSSDNVVRLWDWIGPHDELVPFGQRGTDDEAERPAEEAPPDVFATSDLPASAEDFWGERAGGLHDALEAPTEDQAPGGVGNGTVRTGLASSLPAQGFGRRRAVLAGVAAIAVAAVGIVLTIGVFGSTAPQAGAAKTQIASVLSDGLNRVLSLDLRVTAPGPGRAHAAVRRHGRTRPRSHYVTEVVHYVPSRASVVAAPSHPSVDAASAQATPPSPPPSATKYTSSQPTNSSNASSVPVTATGESGALGPIQSPNG